MGTFIVGLVIVLLVFLAARKIVLDKKRGAKCNSGSCSGCAVSCKAETLSKYEDKS